MGVVGVNKSDISFIPDAMCATDDVVNNVAIYFIKSLHGMSSGSFGGRQVWIIMTLYLENGGAFLGLLELGIVMNAIVERGIILGESRWSHGIWGIPVVRQDVNLRAEMQNLVFIIRLEV